MNEKELLRYPFFIRVGLKPQLKGNKISNLLVKRDDSKRDLLIKSIKHMPNVSAVWFTDHERFDLLVEVKVTSKQDADNMISTLKSVQGVTEAEEDINTIKMY